MGVRKILEDVSFLGHDTVGNYDYYSFVDQRKGKETTILVDFDEGEITGEQLLISYGELLDLNHEESMEYLNTLDGKDIVRSFEHIKSPIRKEKGVEFELDW